MRKLFISILMTSSVLAWAGDVIISSPAGSLQVTVSDAGGRLYYTASLNGQPMILPSALGLKTSIGDMTKELSIVDSQLSAVSNTYTMRGTKASKGDYQATKAVLDIENKDQQRFSIIFQVSDEDLAFRYAVPRQKWQGKDLKRLRIKSELSSFNFPDGTTTFISPQIGPETGWEQTKPSYEEGYSADAAMDTPSQYGHGYIFPALFHLPQGWTLVSETGVGSNYCGSHLSDYQAGNGYTVAYPDAGENNGYGTDFAAIPLPGETPWRTVTLATTLKPIAETTISYDLVEPRYEPSTNYQPGRYTWSWLIWQDHSINYDDQVKFIDLASAMGFEYCLVDNWWDTQIGRDRIEELSKYAQSKGVHLLLWYNSNGFWNDAPQGPRDCMATAISREREMRWMQSIGIKGIKVDFFGGDKQETMRLYEDILSDANRYGLQVVFHGCTVPRGWERMYPNFVASEAVLASENVFFNEGAAIREPFDLTLHPFCRNATASMDWGGIIMNKHLAPDNKSRHPRHTTDIFEMAAGIIMQTSVQCVAMQPNNLTELPQFEMDFLRQLPTAWEETRFIDGYPGRYVVLARKATNGTWYVAGLSAMKEPLTLTLSLPMFAPGQTLQYYVDSKLGEPTLTTLKVDKKGRAKVTIQPNGGLIIQ
ncbi:MAG: glycoside hydrolase family 97 catalytic domain-containing protein [Prevotella sp.]|nr:glycoside hydrolase family 97 catalytic domain-containing protein [Prevotella sp.]